MTKIVKFTCNGPNHKGPAENKGILGKCGTWIVVDEPVPRQPIEHAANGVVMERHQRHFCSDKCLADWVEHRQESA